MKIDTIEAGHMEAVFQTLTKYRRAVRLKTLDVALCSHKRATRSELKKALNDLAKAGRVAITVDNSDNVVVEAIAHSDGDRPAAS